ncbi:MAG: hypothetical protein E6K76_07730 [Candidatus Eisenbacteria bacterium]|uniref:Fibronectin type III domain-containing protein n=1 Tax=Eiseniibacteriota bacterium TaxID=2212470 RepID=A0A538T437_UNCEI|nr:MAG: hypothetical protein E6K76_07730 [Candidatus Eisenbacteria bacterium]
MANRREALSVIAVAGFALLTACSGLYLGFVSPRAAPHGKPVPRVPEQGPILYQMHSTFSKPNRVRLEWRDVTGASGYRVKVMGVQEESLFVSPRLTNNAWVIPQELGARMKRQTVYRWQLTVLFPDRVEVSDPAAFATQ